MTEDSKTLVADEQSALRALVEGTAAHTGERFFAELVRNLALVLGTKYAWATEYLEDEEALRALAFWDGENWTPEYTYSCAGTPCQPVVEKRHLVHFPDQLVHLFPDDAALERMGAASYMGMPFLDPDGKVVGHISVMDTKPMPPDDRAKALIRIFAARAGAELYRLRVEAALREREEELGRLVDSAMDAIIEVDPTLIVTLLNTAGEKMLGVAASELVGSSFSRFLAPESLGRLSELILRLETHPEEGRHLWIPGGLTGVDKEGHEFSAEATLSHFEIQGCPRFTLIVRNVEDRLEAERRIQSLSEDARYLREELEALRGGEGIVGQSGSLLQVIRKVKQVADTDSSVLITGETGTGKELIARALHAASGRRDRPLVKVNCAAIPPTLIESEFFGHEKGSFTGASRDRIGRFELANGGTLFLDEVGEIPIELQSKLLRVLQEGEFERIGENRTRKTDVRIVAATNRDLEKECEEGRFRQDLYYRLNVFPIAVPPLRERLEDVPLLATHFLERFAKEMNCRQPELSAANIAELQRYDWPGNVRELQNVIERAMIGCRGGPLDLDLPGGRRAPQPEADAQEPVVLSEEQMQKLMTDNLRAALEVCGGKVYGDDGAARLLGLKPTTLAARLKKLGIKVSGS